MKKTNDMKNNTNCMYKYIEDITTQTNYTSTTNEDFSSNSNSSKNNNIFFMNNLKFGDYFVTKFK